MEKTLPAFPWQSGYLEAHVSLPWRVYSRCQTQSRTLLYVFHSNEAETWKWVFCVPNIPSNDLSGLLASYWEKGGKVLCCNVNIQKIFTSIPTPDFIPFILLHWWHYHPSQSIKINSFLLCSALWCLCVCGGRTDCPLIEGVAVWSPGSSSLHVKVSFLPFPFIEQKSRIYEYVNVFHFKKVLLLEAMYVSYFTEESSVSSFHNTHSNCISDQD